MGEEKSKIKAGIKNEPGIELNEQVKEERTDYSNCVQDYICSEQKLNELILSFEYIIMIYIKKYHLDTRDFDDIMQEGRIAIYKALLSYKKNHGANLTTYVSICIKRQLLSYIRNTNSKKSIVYNTHVPYETVEGIKIQDQFNLEEEVCIKNNYNEAYTRVKTQIKPVELEIYNKFNYGFTIQELSETYHIPKKRVYVLIGRARQKILKEMNNC